MTDADGDASSASVNVTVNTPVVDGSTITLTWTAPTTKTDNTPLSLSEIAGYSVYVGTDPGNLFAFALINDGSTTQYTIDNNLLSGSYYVAITSFDAEFNESAYSNIIAIH